MTATMTRYGVSHDRQYAAVPYTPAARSRYSSGLQRKERGRVGLSAQHRRASRYIRGDYSWTACVAWVYLARAHLCA